MIPHPAGEHRPGVLDQGVLGHRHSPRGQGAQGHELPQEVRIREAPERSGTRILRSMQQSCRKPQRIRPLILVRARIWQTHVPVPERQARLPEAQSDALDLHLPITGLRRRASCPPSRRLVSSPPPRRLASPSRRLRSSSSCPRLRSASRYTHRSRPQFYNPQRSAPEGSPRSNSARVATFALPTTRCRPSPPHNQARRPLPPRGRCLHRRRHHQLPLHPVLRHRHRCAGKTRLCRQSPAAVPAPESTLCFAPPPGQLRLLPAL